MTTGRGERERVLTFVCKSNSRTTVASAPPSDSSSSTRRCSKGSASSSGLYSVYLTHEGRAREEDRCASQCAGTGKTKDGVLRDYCVRADAPLVHPRLVFRLVGCGRQAGVVRVGGGQRGEAHEHALYQRGRGLHPRQGGNIPSSTHARHAPPPQRTLPSASTSSTVSHLGSAALNSSNVVRRKIPRWLDSSCQKL